MNKTVREGLDYIQEALSKSSDISAMIALMVLKSIIKAIPDTILDSQLEAI